MSIGLKLLLRIIHFIRRDKRKWTWSLKKYTLIEGDEILGKKNLYYTGREVCHSPTRGELAENYTEKGGAIDFATRYVHPEAYCSEIKKEIKKRLNNSKLKLKNMLLKPSNP